MWNCLKLKQMIFILLTLTTQTPKQYTRSHLENNSVQQCTDTQIHMSFMVCIWLNRGSQLLQYHWISQLTLHISLN